jgi:type IV secretory pathway VirB2 component (pilin)
MNHRKTLLILTLLGCALIAPEVHAASTGGGGGLPYESALEKLKTSITGPVASTIALISIVGCVGVLIFGGELGNLFRTLIFIVMGGAIIVTANNFLSFLGGQGADIRGPAAVHALTPGSP